MHADPLPAFKLVIVVPARLPAHREWCVPRRLHGSGARFAAADAGRARPARAYAPCMPHPLSSPTAAVRVQGRLWREPQGVPAGGREVRRRGELERGALGAGGSGALCRCSGCPQQRAQSSWLCPAVLWRRCRLRVAAGAASGRTSPRGPERSPPHPARPAHPCRYPAAPRLQPDHLHSGPGAAGGQLQAAQEGRQRGCVSPWLAD
jgi:hypothetical protein